MDIKPIKTVADYRATLAEIEKLMVAEPGSPEGDKLDVLVTLVEAYERLHYPLELPDPVDTLKFEMERRGWSAKDLEPILGRRNRVYEILNRKRPLTLRMIWRLNQELGIPADALIKPPQKCA